VYGRGEGGSAGWFRIRCASKLNLAAFDRLKSFIGILEQSGHVLFSSAPVTEETERRLPE